MSVLNSLHIIGLSAQFLIVSLLTLQVFVRHDSIDTKEDLIRDVYDYIVVGAGSAGCIIAHRLAQHGKSVLLLEAGGASSLATDIPSAATTALHFNSQFDWNYTMEHQFVGRAFLGGVIPENRGFGIGGSSSINTMIYNRGNRRDYDAWAQQYGAVGWSYKDVMPFFLKFEANKDPHIVKQNPAYHSTRGPVGVTSWSQPDPLMLLNQRAVNIEAGISTTDINGPNQLGTAIAQAFIDTNGVRSSASNSYIDPNPFPHNLHILSGAFVVKILFNDKTAVGVLFERKGHGYQVMASKEVVLSAGVHNSPQLLMLSGIGPKDHLEQFDIPVLKDLPVGENFHNHPSMDYFFIIKQQSYKLLNIPGQLTTQQLHQWLTKNGGPLAQYYRSITYFNTKSNPDKEWPNAAWELGVYLFPQNLTDFRFYQFENDQAWARYLQSYLGKMFLWVHPILERFRSRGWVRLASADPHLPPRIQPFFLRNQQDMQDEIEMIKAILKFYELSSIAQHLEPMKPIPGCSFCGDKKYMFECESYIRCTVEQVLYTTYHGVGTCRMGDPHRKDTVVDPQLRVKGISRLRVCDASIAPLLPNANTNAMSFMIGEKCAHIIQSDNY